MSYANPSFETNIHRGMRPVFWQEILLTRVYVAQRVFKSTGWCWCFQTIITGSFRSLLPPHAEFIRFGKRSCSSLVAACLSVLMSSRPIVARDTLRNSERSNFQLAQMPILLPGISAGAGDYLADSVPLCSVCPHLHIRGCLDSFILLAFRGFEGLGVLWAPLGSPFLLKWGKAVERTAADFSHSGLWFSCLVWSHIYRVHSEILRDARPLGKINIVEQKKVCI